jgi:hypothetical protein
MNPVARAFLQKHFSSGGKCQFLVAKTTTVFGGRNPVTTERSIPW